MENPLYKTTVKQNFSFVNLANKINGIINDSAFEIKDSVASYMKRKIDSGDLRALSETTLNFRKEGKSSFEGHEGKPTTETRPLLYTKRLYDSIKPNDKGIEMYDYGLSHHRGFQAMPIDGMGSGKYVHPRRFIPGLDGESLKNDVVALRDVNEKIHHRVQQSMRGLKHTI